MVSFEIFVKAMPPSLSELKVLPSFCFAFKIPDDRAVTNIYTVFGRIVFRGNYSFLNLTLCTVTFAHSTYRCGNYSREEIKQGRKLFAEIR